MLGFAVRDEGTNADDRVVDVLWEFVADGLAHLYVGLADKIISGREAAEVGHSLQVPHDDAWFHWTEYDRPRFLGPGAAGRLDALGPSSGSMFNALWTGWPF